MAPTNTVSPIARTGESTAMSVECSARFSSTRRMARVLSTAGRVRARFVRAGHEQADPFHGHFARRAGLRQVTARDHGDAVGDLEDLVDVLADRQDCRTG